MAIEISNHADHRLAGDTIELALITVLAQPAERAP